jgi:SAM-dependent methyltransferase
MHDSAFEKAQVFRSTYLAPYENEPLTVLDVGSAVVAAGHRSNREALTNPAWRYVGLDIEPGPNVDVVVADPYDWREVETGSIDVVACSQVLEHTEFFWITILEIARVLRPNGLAFIVAPGAGPLHRYPVDCWRFYDDGLPALAKWADLAVIESRVQWRPVYRRGNQWRDAAIVLQRPVRAPVDDARASARNLLLKAAYAGADVELTATAFETLRPSVIRPASPLEALAAHEDFLLSARSALSHKLSLAGFHFRAIRRLAATKLSEIRSG